MFPVKTDLSPPFAFPVACCCRTPSRLSHLGNSLYSRDPGAWLWPWLLPLPPCVAWFGFEATGLQFVRQCQAVFPGLGRGTPSRSFQTVWGITWLSAATLEGCRSPLVWCLETPCRQLSFYGGSVIPLGFSSVSALGKLSLICPGAEALFNICLAEGVRMALLKHSVPPSFWGQCMDLLTQLRHIHFNRKTYKQRM